MILPILAMLPMIILFFDGELQRMIRWADFDDLINMAMIILFFLSIVGFSWGLVTLLNGGM